MSSIPNQITPSGVNPYVNQMTFGQIVGRVAGYNRGASLAVVQNTINDVARRVYDRRDGQWHGLMTKGQFSSPGYYSTGTVSLVNGSASVTGNGTTFTSSMVGQQLRVGFTAPIYTIIAVPNATTLILELPWGMPTQLTTSYFITQYYYSFTNVRYLAMVKNLQLMFRMYTNIPVTYLDTWDPSRLQLFFARVVANMPPDTNGNAQFELWPAPSTAQAFPWLGFIQPPNLVNDADPLPPFIRADIIELGSIAEILLVNPKSNPGYSENLALQMSARFKTEFERELEYAARIDEGLYRKDVLSQFEMFPLPNMDWQSGQLIGGGGYLASMTAVSTEDYY